MTIHEKKEFDVNMMFEKEKEELAYFCKKLYERGLVAASDGNVSRQAAEDYILLTPSGKNKGFIQKEDILVVNRAGEMVEGEGKPSKELPMHLAVYRGRADVGAVVHTHPVFATAFALAGKNLPDNELIEMRMMLGCTALAEYACPGTPEMAKVIVPFLKEANAILLKNHGVITMGKDLMEAYNRMEVVESIAKTIICSKILGEPEVITADRMKELGK